jgi:electron transfer flavoprotein beta subunit
VRLKEKKQVTEIVAVSIGPKASQDVIRTAMAVGADRGIHVETNLRTDQELQPLAVAKILKHVAEVSRSQALNDRAFIDCLIV